MKADTITMTTPRAEDVFTRLESELRATEPIIVEETKIVPSHETGGSEDDAFSARIVFNMANYNIKITRADAEGETTLTATIVRINGGSRMDHSIVEGCVSTVLENACTPIDC